MTRNIRKDAPPDCEYFTVLGNLVIYYKCDEYDSVYQWINDNWVLLPYRQRVDLHADMNVHILNDDVFERWLPVVTSLCFVLILYWYW